MENASKALLMAGGVLLAIIILSLVIYMANSASILAEAQETKALVEQTNAFNKEYEAYNKRRLYGTDIITVVNKAINHNETIGVETTNPYYINITITIKESFSTTGTKTDNTKPTNNTKDMSKSEIETITGKTVTDTLTAGTYELGYWKKDELTMNKGILEFFSGDKNDLTKSSNDKKITYYIYSALTNFKRAIFTCNGIQYNEETGRVQSLGFEQINPLG